MIPPFTVACHTAGRLGRALAPRRVAAIAIDLRGGFRIARTRRRRASAAPADRGTVELRFGPPAGDHRPRNVSQNRRGVNADTPSFPPIDSAGFLASELASMADLSDHLDDGSLGD
jgi:hypothetical protein